MALSPVLTERISDMSNMNYCRFTNTRSDMEDCLEALRDEKPLSDFEVRAGKAMFKDILEACQNYGIIDAFDGDEVDRLFDNLLEKEDEDE